MSQGVHQLEYSPIIDYNYSKWFLEYESTNKVLTNSERFEFISMTDEHIAIYSEGILLFHSELERFKDRHDDYS